VTPLISKKQRGAVDESVLDVGADRRALGVDVTPVGTGSRATGASTFVSTLKVQVKSTPLPPASAPRWLPISSTVVSARMVQTTGPRGKVSPTFFG
jgi:hypothetical protein